MGVETGETQRFSVENGRVGAESSVRDVTEVNTCRRPGPDLRFALRSHPENRADVAGQPDRPEERLSGKSRIRASRMSHIRSAQIRHGPWHTFHALSRPPFGGQCGPFRRCSSPVLARPAKPHSCARSSENRIATYLSNSRVCAISCTKVHILDPGLSGWILGYRSRASLMQGPAPGALAESAVVSELVKAAGHGGSRAQLFHWQSPSAEVDLVAEIDGRLYGVEIKATRTPTPRHAAHLARWCDLSGARGILACQTERSHAIGHGIRAVPWHLGVAPAADST